MYFSLVIRESYEKELERNYLKFLWEINTNTGTVCKKCWASDVVWWKCRYCNSNRI